MNPLLWVFATAILWVLVFTSNIYQQDRWDCNIITTPPDELSFLSIPVTDCLLDNLYSNKPLLNSWGELTPEEFKKVWIIKYEYIQSTKTEVNKN